MSQSAGPFNGSTDQPQLLATKVFVPRLREGLVPRPQLMGQLDTALRNSLTLVSAPAGFGKTTLLAEWLASRPQSACWLSLDAADNDPARFLAYLIAALQTAVPGLAGDLLALLRSPQPPSAEAVVTSLVNSLASILEQTTVVLDDYHLITSAAVTGILTSLLEGLPRNVHLVVATRADPPIPIPRLRARGQAVELRADDLRFTPDEAAAFLNQTMGLALSAEQVRALDERTEGWIAGLQMAALSMRGRTDVEGFIKAFTGTNRFVLDFLVEEVLSREPEEVQAFLLQTSILSQLSEPLCDAVTERADGQEMLERLERRNLFVVALDDERRWYRYHHLFADLLQAQLQKSLGAQGVARLHQRAAEWYERYGPTLEAIHHASIASDFDRVERLIERSYADLRSRGELGSMHLWTSKLSRELVYSRPRLCIYEALSCSWFGELEEADRLLTEAEQRVRSGLPDPDMQSLLGLLMYVQSRVAAMHGDMPRAMSLSLSARENVPIENPSLRLGIGITLGYEYFLDGDLAHATETLQEVVGSSHAANDITDGVAAYGVLARLYAIQGRLRRAYDLLQEAARWIQSVGGSHLGATAIVEVGIADVLCEWGDLEAALVRLRQGLDLLPWWGKADDVALAYAALARIHRAQGNRAAAGEAVEKAVQVVHDYGVFSEARDAAETAQVRWWLAQGDLQPAVRWADSLDGNTVASSGPSQSADELAQVTRARVYLAQGRLDEAIALLSRLEEAARSSGRVGRLIQIMILRALAMQRMGDAAQADTALAECLALAEPEGYFRVFADEGEPVAQLLRRLGTRGARSRGSGSYSAGYLARLLQAFGAPGGGRPSASAASPARTSSPSSTGRVVRPAHSSPPQPLVEPLSERELEVLALMAEGLTNDQIASRLIIALGTVKAHVHNISGKLGAQNRAQAVARAKELDLL